MSRVTISGIRLLKLLLIYDLLNFYCCAAVKTFNVLLAYIRPQPFCFSAFQAQWPAFAAAQVPRPYRCPTRERGIETIKLWLTFGKTRAVIRPRVRRSVVRVRIDETAIRVRIVARTANHAPTGLSTVPREPSFLAAPAQTQPNSGRRTPQRISFVVHRYFVFSLFRFYASSSISLSLSNAPQ